MVVGLLPMAAELVPPSWFMFWVVIPPVVPCFMNRERPRASSKLAVSTLTMCLMAAGF